MSMDDFQGLEQEQRCGQLESHKCVLTKHICANEYFFLKFVFTQ